MPNFDLVALAWRHGLPFAEQPVQAVRRPRAAGSRCKASPCVRPYDARRTVPLCRHSIGGAEARLHERRGGQAVVVVQAHAELERRIAGLDVVLDVGRLLLDRWRLVVRERRSAAVRSNGANAGLKLPSSPAKAGSAGSVIPNVNFSCSLVAPMVPPNFTLCAPAVTDMSAFTPMFVSFRSWLTVAGVIGEADRRSA